MVRLKGIEPPTPSTGNWCSIRLSLQALAKHHENLPTLVLFGVRLKHVSAQR